MYNAQFGAFHTPEASPNASPDPDSGNKDFRKGLPQGNSTCSSKIELRNHNWFSEYMTYYKVVCKTRWFAVIALLFTCNIYVRTYVSSESKQQCYFVSLL